MILALVSQLLVNLTHTLEDEIAKEEEDISAYEEDDKPLTFDDFKKRFQIKHAINPKKEAPSATNTSSNNTK